MIEEAYPSRGSYQNEIVVQARLSNKVHGKTSPESLLITPKNLAKYHLNHSILFSIIKDYWVCFLGISLGQGLSKYKKLVNIFEKE